MISTRSAACWPVELRLEGLLARLMQASGVNERTAEELVGGAASRQLVKCTLMSTTFHELVTAPVWPDSELAPRQTATHR